MTEILGAMQDVKISLKIGMFCMRLCCCSSTWERRVTLTSLLLSYVMFTCSRRIVFTRLNDEVSVVWFHCL